MSRDATSNCAISNVARKKNGCAPSKRVIGSAIMTIAVMTTGAGTTAAVYPTSNARHGGNAKSSHGASVRMTFAAAKMNASDCGNSGSNICNSSAA